MPYHTECWIWTRLGDLKTELLQCADEGKDPSPFREEFLAFDDTTYMSEDAQRQMRVWFDATYELPVLNDLKGKEPSDLEGIRALRPEGPRRMEAAFSDARLLDRLHGAWLGRCCGCFLGKPVEGTRTVAMKEILETQGRWPLDGYFVREGITPALYEKYKLHANWPWTADCNFMPEDDDTNYTATGLAIFKRWGPEFNPGHVAEFWLLNIPFLHVCTAERIAYRNLANGIAPPMSAIVRNPYREWIGAQIRADFWGYVAVGKPELAADYAWRDASISHVKNGIYGEMWVAAMLAAAYAVDDIPEIIRIGLSEIPADCRLARAIRGVLDAHASGRTYDDWIAEFHTRYDEAEGHDWCHTISNAEIVAAGLLWGEGDFGRSICLAVQSCLDTDCNGATVGSVMGMLLGVKGIPAKWADRLCDTLKTGVTGYHELKISAIAAESVEQAKRVL